MDGNIGYWDEIGTENEVLHNGYLCFIRTSEDIHGLMAQLVQQHQIGILQIGLIELDLHYIR